MLVPIQVDVPMERFPWMNWLLLLTLLVCHGMQLSSPEAAERFILGADGYRSLASGRGFFLSSPIDEHPLSWIGHMFLHAGWMHLIGNGLFMWVFGNAICAKIGNFQYLFTWIGLGLAAAATHRVVSDAPVLGASGAINGIVGMFLIMYPLNDITMGYYFLFRAGAFVLSGFWMILLWLGFDLWGMASGGGRVAHVAHLGGFFAGAALAIGLLRTHIIESREYERTILDVWRERKGSRQSSRSRESDSSPPPKRFAPLQPGKRLHVKLPSGATKHLPVSEFERHEAQGKPVDHFAVSEDGAAWTTFGQWRRKQA